MYISTLHRLSLSGLIKAVRSHSSNEHFTHCSFIRNQDGDITILFEQLFLNITRDPLRQDEAGQERSNYSCFCPNRSLSAITPRLSLARLVLLPRLPGPWRLPEAGGEAVCIHSLPLPSSTETSQSSFPLHIVESATAAVALFFSTLSVCHSHLSTTHSAPLLPHHYASVATFFVAFRR